MSTDDNSDVTNSDKKCGKLSKGKRKMKYRSDSTEIHANKKFKSDNTSWSFIEKGRLLEAIKRYGHEDYLSIAKYVGSKSSKQVEEIIEKLSSATLNSSYCERITESVPGKAPIETWMDLFQNIMLHEEDFSAKLSEVLGLITRNEKFDKSDIPHLQWKNIYQYLTDLSENRVSVKALTDVESLVVLDLMNSLHDTFQQSDPTEHSRVLKIKFDLLAYKSGQTSNFALEREMMLGFISQAFNNDFRKAERLLKGDISLDNQHEEPNFVKPKYLSLNPLCVPTEMIELKKKSTNV